MDFLQQHVTLLLDANNANKATCSVAETVTITEYPISVETQITRLHTMYIVAFKSTTIIKMIKTRKSLDVDVVQHFFVTMKYSTSPSVASAI